MPRSPAVVLAGLAATLIGMGSSALAVKINPDATTFATGTFEIGQSLSFKVVVEGTQPFNIDDPGGTTQVEGPYAYILYIVGKDIYGNDTYIEHLRGQLTGLRGELFAINQTPNGPQKVVINPPTTQTIDGPAWEVPNDGTLHRTSGVGAYSFIFAIYPANRLNQPATATTPAVRFPGPYPTVFVSPTPYASGGALGLFDTVASRGSASPFLIRVTPDLRINAPGATYRAGLYKARDIIRFATSWRNNETMDNIRQSRPLRPVNQDRYVVNLRLSTDPEYRKTTGANDDFNLMYGANGLVVTGDLAGAVADGTTWWRKVTVAPTPIYSRWLGKIPPYGILIEGSVPPAFIPETQRDYTPQPDDGFLDIGESVDFVTEHLIPASYTGRYFVASDVTMSDAELDARPGNNTFVSNAANKIEVQQGTSATVEPVSAIMDQNANFVQGGDAASDFGAVSDGGNFIAFASRAQNLLVPPNQVTGTTIPAQYQTTGQQIFLRNRPMRETVLASRSAAKVQANADCYNPDISANGKYVAYESAASNLVDGANTSNKSMIYVYDVDGQRPVIVSRNRNGELANGDCMNPSISESGRFVAFESIATNLDLPQFTAVLSGGRGVTSIVKVRGGAGYNPAVPPVVTVSTPQQADGVRATAVAVVESDPTVANYGSIRRINVTNQGSGYTSEPIVTVAPPPASYRQIYLHDRDVDGEAGPKAFDAPGNTATYLVSINQAGVMAGQFCNMPVINMQDDAATITKNGGMFVSFVSYAKNPPSLGLGPMPRGTGYAMVYRTLVNVTGSASSLGAVPSSVIAVSVNDADQAPTADGYDPSGAYIVPYSWEPSISGDGSQVAFTSAGVNLVYNAEDDLFDGDTNLVPDVFVRNLDPDLPYPTTVRVSVSQERVATGTIIFASAFGAPGNLPVNQPALGDFVEVSDGFVTKRFTFALTGAGDNVPIGPSVQATRNGLVAKINGAGMNIIAEATTPPDAAPGTAYNAAIYLKNTLPGKKGNAPITVSSAVLVADGMAGGGSQAEDAPVAVQGVPFGSNQPSIDRTGRFVAYRSIAQNMDVHVATDSNSYPESPITGELIRPLIFPSSNVYLHDRLADGDVSRPFDETGNYLTSRVSVSKFGYPAIIFGSEPNGVGATTSANSSAPALSPDARFIAFSSDSSGAGGLIYGPNNLSPLDSNNVRDVLVYDRVAIGDNPPVASTKPTVTLLSPADGLRVAPNTAITISASARPATGKTISSVQFYVNNVLQETDTAEPFSITYTVPNTGDYLIRAVATDSGGLTGEVFATIYCEAPPAGAPFVQMTQPIAGLNFVTGSKLFLNAQVSASGTATIKDESVKLSVNGIDSTDPIGKLGNRYGVLYTPTEPFIVDTYRASATDSFNVSNQSAPLFSFLTLALSPLPEVKVLPFSPAAQVNAGQIVQLSAEAYFPVTGYNNGRIPERVEFYVNKVYVGEATKGAQLANGRALYTLNWEVQQSFVDATSASGTQVFQVYARAVALNWQTNTENDNVIEIYGSVVDGPTPLTVYYVPSNPPAGSNADFVNTNFQKLFLRAPTYDEYSYYLSLLNGGFSQSETVVQMAESPEFAATQEVLFGYYARMGLKPTSKTNAGDPTSVANLLNLMTNGTNVTLLPSTMAPNVSVPGWSGAPPYGATVGQALVAARLIGTITNPWNGTFPKNLGNQEFMNWMRRSFNQPYLPQTMPTNATVAGIGSDAELLTTIASFPATNSAPLTRFGYSYAFLTGLYDSIPLANVANSGLRTSLSNFPASVKGVAVTYLLSPSGTWLTNTNGGIATNAVLSTNLVASNLPPQITSTNRVTGTFGTNYTNFYQILATGVGASPGFGATGLTNGVTNFNAATGIISGTPTAETNYTMIVSATNAAGIGQLAVAVTILPPAPQISEAVISATNDTNFASFKIPVTPTNTAYIYGLTTNLPNGLLFDKTNGVIYGWPVVTNSLPSTSNLIMYATNRVGAAATNTLRLIINPKLDGIAGYLARFSLSGAAAEALADPDGDGFNNAAEFAFGMSPDQRDAALPVTSTLANDQVTLTWTRRVAASDATYTVSTSTNLASPLWTPVAGLTPQVVSTSGLPEGYERVSATINKPSASQSFYRVEAHVLGVK